MKYGFKFNALYGTVFKCGNLLFTPDGNSVVSPVGNRISVFDLANHVSTTLPCETAHDIHRIAMSPDGMFLLAVDKEGQAILINYSRRTILARHNFRGKVRAVMFSPNSEFIAVGVGRLLQIYTTPKLQREFNPFLLLREFTSHDYDITCVAWSSDSKFVVSGAKDLTLRVHTKTKELDITLGGFRNYPVGCYFIRDSHDILALDGNGGAVRYTCITTKKSDQKTMKTFTECKWIFDSRRDETKRIKSKVKCSAYHDESHILVVGYSDGTFCLFDMPNCVNIHSLKISNENISSVVINPSATWIAFGTNSGQLLVWEWQSETYVLKQQSHFYDINSAGYSPDGQIIVTGGDDNKVKVWNTSSGFCFVTFTEHEAPVSAVVISPRAGHNVAFSASLDGTVRAFDLLRYRNFRTFTSPKPAQFATLAVDPSGEIVCAGTLDTFEIYVWSTQTGRLLDILSGHEAPISGLAFNPHSPILASVSWDKTLRFWEVFEGRAYREECAHTADVLALAFRYDGLELCTSSLDGHLSFWDPATGEQLGLIEARYDIGVGKISTDLLRPNKSSFGKCFTSLAYTVDGSCILGAGQSKFIYLYNVAQRLFLKKFQISHNFSLEGVQTHMRQHAKSEPLDDFDLDVSDEERGGLHLPGAKKGDMASRRNVKPIIGTKSLAVSPTGRAWAAATTDGLQIYSLDETLIFDPMDLEIDITPTNINKTLRDQFYLKALVMSLRLNEYEIIHKVVEQIPSSEIQFVVQGFPVVYLKRLVEFLGQQLETTSHLEAILTWTLHLLTIHGNYLKDHRVDFLAPFRNILKNSQTWHHDLSKLCDGNLYSLDFYSTICGSNTPLVDIDVDTDQTVNGSEENTVTPKTKKHKKK